jgi:hypothetical protein
MQELTEPIGYDEDESSPSVLKVLTGSPKGKATVGGHEEATRLLSPWL